MHASRPQHTQHTGFLLYRVDPNDSQTQAAAFTHTHTQHTVHTHWSHTGFLLYRVDPKDSQTKLFYNK